MDRPKTRYARSGELAIAYQVHGQGEHDLLFNGLLSANVETSWTFPEAVRLFERLGRFARVIRFDRRDSGLSDSFTEDLTLEAYADDALAVMDAVGAERPVVLGARELTLLSATHPDRVRALIAISPSTRGVAAATPGLAAAAWDVIASPDYPSSELLARFAPGWSEDPVRIDRLRRGIQSTITPAQAERYLRMALSSDLTDVLPLVQAPTLVLYPADVAIPPETVQEFSAMIPGALIREIPGDGLHVFGLDPDVLADAIEEFVTGTPPAPITNRVLATVMFTDVVGSTERAAESGDRAWAEVLSRHLADARGAVAAQGGETVKTTGDGLLALFPGPAHGVRCAEQVIADARDLGLDVRIGLHAGEVERTSNDVAGIAVHLAARIMGLAGASEILTSRTVRDLVIGSELVFTDRGEHDLQGIPGRWGVHALAGG